MLELELQSSAGASHQRTCGSLKVLEKGFGVHTVLLLSVASNRQNGSLFWCYCLRVHALSFMAWYSWACVVVLVTLPDAPIHFGSQGLLATCLHPLGN